jgi:hypothetical protein
MTDVLDRVEARHEVLPLEPSAPPEPEPTAPGRVDSTRPMLAALAALSAAAGVIHLVMVPSHVAEFAAEGIAFAVTGWLQLLLAVRLWTRPSRPVLMLTVLANVAFIGAWAVSRTAGLPFGPHAGHAESVSVVDLTCVGLEAALVLLAVALLLRPALSAIALPVGLGLVVPIAVMALTSAVLASPEARNHAHGTHGGHGEVAAGHTHASAAAGGGAAVAGHTHGAPVNDRGLSLLSNGHHHQIVNQQLSPATTDELKRQLAITREVALQYPTVADAEAAGYRRAGPFSPGLGTHYTHTGAAELNFDGVMDDADLRHPLAIIYDGSEPTSEIAGFMYYATTSEPPEGFAGGNDVWHYHENICISYSANGEVDAPFGADLVVTAAQCAEVGGFLLSSTQYMVHVWSVPGWNGVDGGVFAEVNPGLDCGDGSYWQLPPSEWADHLLNVCEYGNV